MNFGERIRQLRSDRNLTQPQLAQAIGIEQSYLSKLENDKSVPSADIFQAVLKAFALDVGAFLKGIDERIVRTDLRQIPEVAQLLSADSAQRVHDIKKWLFGSAAACVFGLTCIVAGYRGLLFSNAQYTYISRGVTRPDEPSNIFSVYSSILISKAQAQEITMQEVERRTAEYMSRVNEDSLVLTERRGSSFVQPVAGGSRNYMLMSETDSPPRAENRYLTLLGILLAFAGLFGFFIEYRLRAVRSS